MQLRDYVNSYKGSLEKADFYNGSVKAQYLNSVGIPSPNLIVAHQKKVFKAIANINNFNDPAIKELNNDLMGTNVGWGVNAIDFNEKISKIEKYVDALNQGSAEAIAQKMAEVEPHIKSLDRLIAEFEMFFKNLQKYKSMKEVQYALGPIYNRLNQLSSVAQRLSEGQLGPMPQGSLCKKISWCEYALKGQYLEAAGKEFFAERLPRNIVLETGHIRGYYDIFGSFKSGGQM